MSSRVAARPHVVPDGHAALTRTYDMCTRPASSPPSRGVIMDVNCFRVRLSGSGPLEYFKYDVAAVAHRPPPPAGVDNGRQATDGGVREQRTIPKRIMREIVGELLLQHDKLFGDVRVVHDGRASLYAPVRLGDWNETTVEDLRLTRDGVRQRGGGFDVTLTLVEAISATQLREYASDQTAAANPRLVLQVLDVVLRHLGSQRCIAIGSNLFSPKQSTPLDRTTELIQGVHQSLRIGRPQLFLNVDTVTSVFYAPGSLIDLALEIARVRKVVDLVGCRDRWARAIRRLAVKVTHRSAASPQSIREVGRLGSDQTTMQLRSVDGQEPTTITIAQYFRERYSIRLRYPELPLVNVGSASRPSWLPMEVCEIVVGQRCRDSMTVDTAAVIKHCCVRPTERKRAILDGLRDAAFHNDPFCAAFGLDVSQQMESVPVRSLNPPKLQVHDRQVVAPKNGVWNLSHHKLYRPRRLSSWCVVNLSSSAQTRSVENFIGRLAKELERYGVEVRDHNPLIVAPPHNRNGGDRYGHLQLDVEALLRDAYDRARRRARGELPDLVVVVKERQGPDYGEIKRVSDSVLGVPSQCVLAKNVMRANGQYLGNVALKINLKLRGVNFALARPLCVLSRGTTIIFGADVEYPRSRNQPAIAAVVASMDTSAASYVGRVTPQTSDGLSTVLPTILWELLLKYEERAGTKPERIVYFRDGTSEGLMEDVFQAEIRAIHHAWMMLTGDLPTPPITFVVVSRRHHLRAFPRERDHGDRSGNPPAGTVIDQGVVDPRRFDFYLYGHSGLLGTSRPAHYTVLLNDNALGEKDMEQLCFDLCHVFGRSTRSVSVVTPVYYAKILAARGRVLLDFRAQHGSTADAASTDSDTSSSGLSGGGFPGEPVIDVHRNVRNSEFFV